MAPFRSHHSCFRKGSGDALGGCTISKQRAGEASASAVLALVVHSAHAVPGGAVGKESTTCNEGDARDMGLIPGLGRSPGRGHGNPLQYSCLENPMDRGSWWVTIHRVPKSQT